MSGCFGTYHQYGIKCGSCSEIFCERCHRNQYIFERCANCHNLVCEDCFHDSLCCQCIVDKTKFLYSDRINEVDSGIIEAEKLLYSARLNNRNYEGFIKLEWSPQVDQYHYSGDDLEIPIVLYQNYPIGLGRQFSSFDDAQQFALSVKGEARMMLRSDVERLYI